MNAPDNAMADSASESGHREHHRHRPRATNHDEIPFSLPRSVDTWPYASMRRSHSTASLASSLRRFQMNGAAATDEDDVGSPRWGEPEDRRRIEDERRVTQILADPQLRSKMLIGQEDNRYQWHKFWTTSAELAGMRKPM